MASGADSLCDRRAMNGKLPFEPATMIEPQPDEQRASDELPPLPRDYHDDLPAQTDAVDEESADAAERVSLDDGTHRDEPVDEEPDEMKANLESDQAPKSSERIYH